MAKTYELDMTQGSILKNIVGFVIPLILSSLLQLFYNAADLIVVSRFSGSNAMASVGATTTLNALLVNICIGLSVGAGIIVSRNFGSRNREGLQRAVHTAMIIGVFGGVLCAIIGLIIARPVLICLDTPADVLDGAVLYICILWAALPATMVYNFGAAVLRAVGNTKGPLHILTVTGIINVLLNLVLVIVFHLGVAGVAISTAVANILSAVCVVYSLAHSDGDFRLDFKLLRLSREETKEIIRLGLPAGLQTSVFSLSNTVILSAVNAFGADALKGHSASSNIEGFVYVGMNAFYQAVITAVSQNYGSKNKERIKRSFQVSLFGAAAVGLFLGGICALFARPLLSIYITDSETALDFGVIRMLITASPYFLCGIMEVLAGVIRGLGSSLPTAINSLLGACGFRIFWVACILPLHPTTGFLYLCWPISWIIVILAHIVTYFIVKKRAFAQLDSEERC